MRSFCLSCVLLLLLVPLALAQWPAPVLIPPAPVLVQPAQPDLPAPPPQAAPVEVPNFGVEADKISPEESVTIAGQPVTKEQALERLEAPIPDDASKPFLVLVSANHQQARDRLVQDLVLAPELAPWKDVLRLKSYEPDDPMLKDRDGALMYPPGLWFVRADGLAQGRLAGYDGPAPLAVALRKLPADWNPGAVPDLAKSSPLGLPFQLPDWPWYVWVGLAAGLWWGYLNKDQLLALLKPKAPAPPCPPDGPCPAPAPAPAPVIDPQLLEQLLKELLARMIKEQPVKP